jgi:hypothetical protein
MRDTWSSEPGLLCQRLANPLRKTSRGEWPQQVSNLVLHDDVPKSLYPFRRSLVTHDENRNVAVSASTD